MKDVADKHPNEISPEQYISEHTFAYVIKGRLNVYDGSKQVTLESDESFIARKNRLARYSKEKVNDELEKVFVFFDEPFLRKFQERNTVQLARFTSAETFVPLERSQLLTNFVQSLLPYYSHGKIMDAFADVKREELLLILLQSQSELTGIFFDFGIPQKINIEEFMNRNYKFNVSIERFAYLTGRSLSAFKRDFSEIFEETPGRWLVKKRLQEAHFQIEKNSRKPVEIYLELGFETLQHFSIAFKNQFGYSPSEMLRR